MSTIACCFCVLGLYANVVAFRDSLFCCISLCPYTLNPSNQAITLLQKKLRKESSRADAAEACLKAAAQLTAPATPLNKVVCLILFGIGGDATALLLLLYCVCWRVCTAATRRCLCGCRKA